MIEASSDSHEGSAIMPDETEAVNAEGTSDVNNVIAHGAFRIGSWVISNRFVTLPVSAEVRCDNGVMCSEKLSHGTPHVVRLRESV